MEVLKRGTFPEDVEHAGRREGVGIDTNSGVKAPEKYKGPSHRDREGKSAK